MQPSPTPPPPGHETFTEDDLAPTVDERRAERRLVVSRVAAAIGALGAGLFAGALGALGALTAPVVFARVARPLSGFTMGEIFRRFDRVALALVLVLLAAEGARTWAEGARGRRLGARLRRLAVLVVAAGVAWVGASLGPRIQALHASGAQRGQGEAGVELEGLHRKAELSGKLELAAALALALLHVLTLEGRRRHDEEDDVVGPAPPGPRA